jgi:predicted secreted hydrolase
MKKFFLVLLIGLGGAALIYMLAGSSLFEDQVPTSNLVVEGELPIGFQRAESPREWEFPEDFGPHPEFQTEWWYYTGNLESERFGYQLTIFRRALLPEQERPTRDSAWAADQIYMGHFALSDINAREHHAFERFSRGAAGLAGAQGDPYQVWLEDWQISQIGEDRYRLSAEQDGIAIDLVLEDLKGPILHGDQGYSQKGPDKGNASYYYSQTRLETTGTVQTNNSSYQVSGFSWKDHEFSTSALSEGQVGWDWFSIQLDDGSELMVFQIRGEDGSIDPFSSGTWISPNGETRSLGREQFVIQVEDTWRSPISGGEYPSRWTLAIPGQDLQLQIIPYLADQEMKVSYNYWEGAVQVEGTSGGDSLRGSGYVEMTGYAGSFEGEF